MISQCSRTPHRGPQRLMAPRHARQNSVPTASCPRRPLHPRRILVPTALAQLTERPGNSPRRPHRRPPRSHRPVDQNPRVRVIHTTDPAKAGGSMLPPKVRPLARLPMGPQPVPARIPRARRRLRRLRQDRRPAPARRRHQMMDRSHANSCALCHNTPYRDARRRRHHRQKRRRRPQHPAHVRRRPARDDRLADSPRRPSPSPTPTATAGSASTR